MTRRITRWPRLRPTYTPATNSATALHHYRGLNFLINGVVVVGVGVLHPGAADLTTWPSGTPHIVLRGFLIDGRFQGRGLGTAAARAAIDTAQREYPKASALVLTVGVTNVAARRAYERAGFELTGTQVAGRTEDELVMSASLR